ncbi:MAG TPA: hypothetical protein VEC37_11650 [Bacillota bacterium]|nr:hypothetical protein [Bacillota bacterium]
MGIQKFWCGLQKFWQWLFRRSWKKDTVLDTASVKLFGLEIQVSRELPKDIPYELTVVVPRAEYRLNGKAPGTSDEDLEVLLNSITIAHSPRFEGSNSRSSQSAFPVSPYGVG